MKKIGRHYALNTVVCLLVPIFLFAGNSSKIGTAGATELLLPVGAKGIALGGAMLSNTDGVDALYWNPAGLAVGLGLGGTQALFSNTKYIGGVNISYLALGTSLGQIGTVGLSLKTLDFGKITTTSDDLPDGTGSTYSPEYVTVGLTYSKQLTDRISIGFTGKIVSETIVQTSAVGYAFDAGVIYQVGQNSILSGLKFGIALKNIGTDMQFSGSDLEISTVPSTSEVDAVTAEVPVRYVAQSFELPATYEFGASYDLSLGESLISVAGAFQSSNFSSDYFRGGVEYGFGDFVFVRAGYILQAGGDETQVQKGSFGGGVKIPISSSSLVVDYAYASYKYFDPVHTITVGLSF